MLVIVLENKLFLTIHFSYLLKKLIPIFISHSCISPFQEAVVSGLFSCTLGMVHCPQQLKIFLEGLATIFP